MIDSSPRIVRVLARLSLTGALALVTGAASHAAEIIIDNTSPSGVTLTGTWGTSTGTGSYGANFISDGNAGKGSRSVRFTPSIGTGGPYEVFLWWTAATNRPTNVPITVVHSSGTSQATVNQRENGSQWVSVGTYTFASGTSGSVVIGNANTSGFVIADAVRFAPPEALEAIVDNSQPNAIKVGSWASGTVTPGYYGTDYISDGASGKGTKSVRFVPSLPSSGLYDISARWTSASNRPTNAPYVVSPAGGGGETVLKNQAANGGSWQPLGQYFLQSGTANYVELRTEGTTGKYVIADAVRFTRVPEPEIVIDNTDPVAVTIAGVWHPASSTPGFHGTDYLSDGASGKGLKSVRYTPNILEAGNYEVFMQWSAATNRPTNVPVTITAGNTIANLQINQRLNGGAWNSLGIYQFPLGLESHVLMGTQGTPAGSYVIADAVKFKRRHGQWNPSELGDQVWLEWRAEDLPDGPVAIWSDRKVALSGTQTVTSRQPVKQNGEVYFAGGSSSNYNQGKGLIFNRLYDGKWLPEVTHRAIALVFRIDLSGSQSGGTIFSVNGQSGAAAARQPAVNYNAVNNTISVGFNSPSSQPGVVVAPYVANNAITFPLTSTAADWHCLVARRVGTNLHASLDGKDVNGVEGETVIPMADWALPPNNQGPYPEDPDGDNGLIGDHAKARPNFAIDSIFLVQGDMTTETAKKFMGWGLWKKGAQASLPATHPYRHAPPPPSAPRPAFVESTPQQWIDLVNFWDNAALSETPYEGDPINLTGWTEVFRDDFNQHSVTDDIRGQGTWFAPGHKAAAGNGVTAVRPTVNMANRAIGGEGTPSTYRHNATEGTMTLRMQLHQSGTASVWHTGLFASVNSNGYGRTWMYPYAEIRMKIGPSSTGTTKGIWPAFWFKSLNFYTNRTETNVEYDIYEGYGSSGNLSQHHASIHNWPAWRLLPGRLATHRYRSNIYGLEIQNGNQWHENVNLFDGQYHTYATMVTPTWVINYFDGREMHRFPTPIEMKQPLWLLTSLAMKDASQAAGIYDLTIDYIRVMQNPAYAP